MISFPLGYWWMMSDGDKTFAYFNPTDCMIYTSVIFYEVHSKIMLKEVYFLDFNGLNVKIKIDIPVYY